MAGEFRRDLFHRLECFVVHVPALRERRGDVAAIARELLHQLAPQVGPRTLSPAALARLAAHDWPGNVRELRNSIERAMILEDSSFITASSLTMTLSQEAESNIAAAASASGETAPQFPARIPDEGLSLEENERRLLVGALEKTGGNQTQAARLLRITRDTLRYKMKKFNLR
jgi:DNA-binding NtrC family response regulator